MCYLFIVYCDGDGLTAHPHWPTVELVASRTSIFATTIALIYFILFSFTLFLFVHLPIDKGVSLSPDDSLWAGGKEAGRSISNDVSFVLLSRARGSEDY